MSQRSEPGRDGSQPVIAPPRWARHLMAIAGAALLFGPTIAVLWPR